MRKFAWMFALLLIATATAPAIADDGIEELREEVQRLRERVAELEGRAGAPAEAPFADDLDVLGEAMDRISDSNVTAPLVHGLKLGGQVRLQAEDQMNYDLNDDVGDTKEFGGPGVRVTFDADIGTDVRAFVKLQDARLWGDEHAVNGRAAGVDLKEGYVDLRELFANTVIRLGRQELLYGDQRLVSPLDWDHVGRAWDGARVMWSGEGGTFVHLFVTRIDERGLGSGQDENEDFLGLYGSFRPMDDHVADAYLFWNRNRDADDITGENGMGGHQDLFTLGGRFKGKSDAFAYVIEAALQFGDHADDDIMAWMIEAELAYALSESGWKPRVGAGWILASGDDDPSDGDRNTFDPLYTFGHFYLGHADRVGRKNINSPRIFLDLTPSEGVNLSADVHFFWLMTEKDALYHAGGGVLRGGMAGADKFVGWEIDLHAKWKWTKNVTFWTGYAHFFAGDFLDDTGSADDADFLFIQVTVDF